MERKSLIAQHPRKLYDLGGRIIAGRIRSLVLLPAQWSYIARVLNGLHVQQRHVQKGATGLGDSVRLVLAGGSPFA